MGRHHKHKQRGEFEKLATKPQGSSLRIFWRLFKEFARPYWFRLLLGVLAGLIMGGAMHLYLSFLHMGVTCLEAGSGKGAGKVEHVQENISDNLTKKPLVKWALKFIDVDLQKDTAEIIEEEKKPDTEAKNEVVPIAEKGGKESNLLNKINSVCGNFGIEFSSEDSVSFPVIFILIFCMLLFFALRAIGEFMNKYFLQWVGSRIVADIRYRLFRNIQRQSMSFFDKNDVGQMISRCTYDAGIIDHAFSGAVSEAFIAPIQILVAMEFLILTAINSNMLKPVLILIVILPVMLVPLMLFSKLIKDYQRKVLARVSVLVGMMQETFSGIRIVKSYNSEEREEKRFDYQNGKYFKAVIKAVLADIFMQPSMQIVAILLGAVFLLLCFRYNVSLGVLAVLGYAAQNAYKPIKELAKLNINLQKCAAAAERVFETLDVNTALPEPENPVYMDNIQKGIVFENVTFSYNDEAKVIDNFSLDIKKGQFVAIVGATGSGKSTVANLLARFYDPQNGRISIDGVDIRNIANENLRQLIGVVSQENFLFKDTIANNIKYGRPEADFSEIEDAAQRANAMDFINESPEGFDRNVGERGCQLSGGQRQRLAIARAILRNPPVLILDEATSALDTVTEQAVQIAITQLMKERTVLAIAHRLSTVINADCIVVLDHGRIVEQGTHSELYALNGKYRMLYDMQVNGMN